MTDINTNIGEAMLAVVRSVDPKQHSSIKWDHLLARSAGRMLEEAVELAIVFGVSPEKIMAHVVDAIHNECKKVGYYPSQFKAMGTQRDQKQELGDMVLQLEHLRTLAKITPAQLDEQVTFKLTQVKKWADDGQMVLLDGLMYRRGVRGGK